MIEFAVQVSGLTKEGQASWVLDVDPAGERLLLAHEDKTLHWHPMAECLFAKLMPPDAPRAVIPVQPAPVPQIAVPQIAMPNRAERRHGMLNGH